jgi:hypothetical protein
MSLPNRFNGNTVAVTVTFRLDAADPKEAAMASFFQELSKQKKANQYLRNLAIYGEGVEHPMQVINNAPQLRRIEPARRMPAQRDALDELAEALGEF